MHKADVIAPLLGCCFSKLTLVCISPDGLVLDPDDIYDFGPIGDFDISCEAFMFLYEMAHDMAKNFSAFTVPTRYLAKHIEVK